MNSTHNIPFWWVLNRDANGQVVLRRNHGGSGPDLSMYLGRVTMSDSKFTKKKKKTKNEAGSESKFALKYEMHQYNWMKRLGNKLFKYTTGAVKW